MARGHLAREVSGDDGGDALAAWAERTGRRRAAGQGRGGLRFAFYGRVTTEDHQDPVTSLARQRDQARALVAGHGQMVAEFFDIGQSRTLPWARRPQAACLVAALADPDRDGHPDPRTGPLPGRPPAIRVPAGGRGPAPEQGPRRLGDAGRIASSRTRPPPVVQWMFAQRLAGHSAARITRALNDAGIPCPSAADPERNPHRTGAAWTLRTVAAILANPRYTGRQVWNRQ